MTQRYSAERPWRRVRRTVTIPAPAAGADWSTEVPSGKLWELLAVFGALVTDATVADRAVRLQLGDGNVTYLEVPAGDDQAASLTTRYSWAHGGSTYAVGSGVVTTLPRLTLEPGWSIGVATDNLASGDAWGAVQLLVIETTVRSGDVDLASLPALVVEVAGPASS